MDHFKNSFIGLIAGINGMVHFYSTLIIYLLGGIATVYVGQPLDTIKVKMQTFPDVYSNAWKCFRVTFVKDGIKKGLYAGTVPALAANIAENAVLFCALPPSQHLISSICGKPTKEPLTDLQHACAGSLAAFWSSLTLCPTELVKCKIQAMREMAEFDHAKLNRLETGPWAVTKSIYHKEGFRGFFRGLSATFAREIPGYFFFFGGYEAARTVMAGGYDRKHELNTATTALCGGFGGCLLWTSIFPFDVIKSRMQIGHLSASPAPSIIPDGGKAVAPLNMFTMLVQIARQEGVGALYRGLGPSLLRTIPASGALFVAVEWTRTCGHWVLS